MGDFDIEDIKKAVGYDENSDSPSEEVKIIKDDKQYRIRIPKKFADIAELNPEKDTFRVVLEKSDEKEGKPDIHIFLVRG